MYWREIRTMVVYNTASDTGNASTMPDGTHPLCTPMDSEEDV